MRKRMESEKKALIHHPCQNAKNIWTLWLQYMWSIFWKCARMKGSFLTHQLENNEDKQESPDEDPLEKALDNALRVITFVAEGVLKNDFMQFSDRKEDIAKYLGEWN